MASTPARGTLLSIVMVVLAGTYVAVGLSYASSAWMDIAGFSGPMYYLAWAMQVLGWPLMLVTQA